MRVVLLVTLLGLAACSPDKSVKPAEDPFALIWVTDRFDTVPEAAKIYAIYATYPNRPDTTKTALGSVRPGDQICSDMAGLPDATLPDSTVVVLIGISEPNGEDTLQSPPFSPFTDTEATSPAVAHRIAWFLTDTGLVLDHRPHAASFPEWPAVCARP